MTDVLLADVMDRETGTASGGGAPAREAPAWKADSAHLDDSVEPHTETMAMNVLVRRPIGGMPLPPTPPSPALRPGLEAPPPVRARADELAQHMPRLRSVIRRIQPNEIDAEDVLQDVMLSALQKLPTFRGDAQLGTWLHRIAVNAALQNRRRKAQQAKVHEMRVEDGWLGDAGPAAPARKKSLRPDQETIRDEGSRLIQAAIAKLPPLYREVYLLADVDDQPNEQIAENLKLKIAAVKSRLHRARKMMRDQLAPHFAADAKAQPAPAPQGPASAAPSEVHFASAS